MRNFNNEFHTVGGWHDGIRTRVVDVASVNPLVSAHEMMHARIFRETPDGQLYAAFSKAVDGSAISETDAQSLTESVAHFFESSRLPHESFATYLSIKSMLASAESSLLSQLTPIYGNYFRLLAEIIDINITSSYLQFLLGWNCAVVIFSSPLLERFHAIDISKPITLNKDENAEQRFTLLIELLHETDYNMVRQLLKSSALDACERNGFDYWDIFSEEAWAGKNYAEGQICYDGMYVEEALSTTILEWLSDVTPFPFLSGDRLKSAFVGYEQMMWDKLKIRTIPWTEYKIGDSNVSVPTLSEAVLESESRVVNSGYLRLKQGNAEVLCRESTLDTISSFAVYSAAPPNHNLTTWNVFLWDIKSTDADAIPTMAAAFNSKEVITFLQMWIEKHDSNSHTPFLRAIVLAINGGEDYMRIMVDTEFLLYRQKELFSKLCWYGWGGYIELYELCAKLRSKLFAGTIHTNELLKYKNHDLIETVSQYNGLVIKLLHLGDQIGTGLFCRAFPMRSAVPVITLERELIEGGNIHPMTLDMTEQFSPLVKEVLYAAQLLWEEY